MENNGKDIINRENTSVNDKVSTKEKKDSASFDAKNSERAKYSVSKDYWVVPVNRRKKTITSAFYIFFAALFYAVGFHYFVSPCGFAPGGIGGVVAIVQHLCGITSSSASTGVDWSAFLFIICNVPLLIPAYKTLNREFVVKTAIACVLLASMMFLLDNFIDKDFTKFSIWGEAKVEDIGKRLLSAIVGGAVCGVSLAFALKTNASTGGADIVGAMLQKKNPHKSVASMVFAVNAVIFAISAFVYQESLTPVYLSLIYTFATTKTCDYIMYGAKSALKYEVITEHAEEISKEIIEQLGHAATVTPAEGMFERKTKSLLICLIKPRQTARFQEIISRYPETFAYVGSVSEVIGKFNSTEKKK